MLHAADVPAVTKETWSLTVSRPAVRKEQGEPLTLDWAAYAALPRVEVFADFHCVTRWSRLGTTWAGVSTRTIAALAGWPVPDDPTSAAGYVIAGGADAVGSGKNWTTNLPLADFFSPHALLCDTADGIPLPADHGAPVRLIVPHLYAWKSAKWLVSLRLSDRDEPGYWERLGYADRGDPWLTNAVNPDGERFRDSAGRRPDGGDEAMMI
ncbi:molybdopterin-dependent oxidoreductase [Alienimonas californiensis]|uniref:Sulfoxide reductase catalytic subunit YedY n=1 Tax=Alienimonas californiensis TaxID=2527989 RepID=A0A517PFC7_9PLAN|nr:molybdopterin-dependent oxidoreductase [Alienimonas californiensis]QDT18078.1 Sulfoxide reductase catalytic subunit YedY precursor [Alienimonas californiensis]